MNEYPTSMKIARVFPTKTSMSPNDTDAYFGEPDLFTPEQVEWWMKWRDNYFKVVKTLP